MLLLRYLSNIKQEELLSYFMAGRYMATALSVMLLWYRSLKNAIDERTTTWKKQLVIVYLRPR